MRAASDRDQLCDVGATDFFDKPIHCAPLIDWLNDSPSQGSLDTR